MKWLEQKRKAYILENGLKPRKVWVSAYDNTFFIVKFETGGAIRLRRSKVYYSLEEAVETSKRSNSLFMQSNSLFMQSNSLYMQSNSAYM